MREKFLIYHFCLFLVVFGILGWPLNSLASKSKIFRSDYTLLLEPGRAEIDLDNQMVQSVDISPDEKLLAAGGHDSTLRIWDFKTCELRKIVKFKSSRGDFTNIVAVKFSPDGNLLAVGGKDAAIYLWRAKLLFRNQTPIKLVGHSAGIRSIAFSQDGHHLASAGHDGSIRIWRFGKEIEEHAVLLGHEKTVYSVTFSKDGKTLLSGGEDKTVRLWDLELQKQRQQLTTPGTVRVAKFTPDGKYIVGAIENYDGAPPVMVWDSTLKQSIKTLLGHKDLPTALAISLDGNHVASGGYDGTIRLWDILRGKLLKTLRTEVPVGRSNFLGRQEVTYPNQPVRTLTFTKDGKYIVSGSYEFTPWLWDRESGKVLKVYRNKGCEP